MRAGTYRWSHPVVEHITDRLMQLAHLSCKDRTLCGLRIEQAGREAVLDEVACSACFNRRELLARYAGERLTFQEKVIVQEQDLL